MQNLINYLKDTISELKRVSWPTNRQNLIYTALVVVVSFIVALYIGLFDFLFTKALDQFIL